MSLQRIDASGNTQFLKIDRSRKSLKTGIFVYDFTDGQHVVAYLPPFELSAYGDTKEEAMVRLEEVMDDYFDYLMRAPEPVFHEELRRLGWKRSGIFKKKFLQTAYVDRDGLLKNFNLSEETQINERFLVTP